MEKSTDKNSSTLNSFKKNTLKTLLGLPEIKKIETPELFKKNELIKRIIQIKIDNK